MEKKISRRSFLTAAGMMAAAGVLTACGGSSTAGSTAGSATAAAGDVNWPTTSVSVILPYKAGGDTDTYCRALFQDVGKALGQTFVVTNEEGGSGMVAAMDVMNKKPDGYTCLFNHTGASLVQEATGTAEFSYTDNFTNVCTVAQDRTYTLVALSADGQYKSYAHGWTTLEDMLADAKAAPGSIRYSTVFGSTTQYVGQMLEKQAGVEFDNIDVGTSAGDRMAALMGGQVDIVAINYMNVADYIEAGDLICLGVMSDTPVDGINFPTFAEQGYDKVVSTKKYEVKFPKGVDQAIVDKLAAACKEVVESDSFAETLKKFYAEPLWRDADTMNKEDPEEVEALKAGLAE